MTTPASAIETLRPDVNRHDFLAPERPNTAPTDGHSVVFAQMPGGEDGPVLREQCERVSLELLRLDYFEFVAHAARYWAFNTHASGISVALFVGPSSPSLELGGRLLSNPKVSMNYVSLGRTRILVPQLAFGALPLQRVPAPEAIKLLRRAFDAGIRFFDTARAYSDSEEKLGLALHDVRDQIVIATKTMATDAAGARGDLETSLSKLQTKYIDIIQLHNPAQVPDPNDEQSAYAALSAARSEGLVRFVGITNHRRQVAYDAVASGLFDTLQFPLSHISSADDLSLVEHCQNHEVGFIAMKALCGGLLTNVTAAFAFFRTLPSVVPIWGIQRESELAEFLALDRQSLVFSREIERAIEKDRQELATSFCRGCGYCLPCPAEIPIPMAARMSFLLRRAPHQQFLTPTWQQNMQRIGDCTECRDCASRCPYGLDTPGLLKSMLVDYDQFLGEHVGCGLTCVP